jgi:HK97 family phage prohead protease
LEDIVSTNTVVGVLADADGLAANTVTVPGRHGPELRKSCFATGAAEFRSVQPPRIPIDRAHDRQWVGEIVYLERRNGNLWAVGHVDDAVIPAVDVQVGREAVRVTTDAYWSAATESTDDYRDIALTSVALTARSARVAAQPVTFLPGKLDHGDAPRRWTTLDAPMRELLMRAARAHLDRPRGTPLVIADLDVSEDGGGEPLRLRASRALEIRSAQVADVTPSARIIELVIAPAESPSGRVVESGRFITELFAHGAFAGCEKNPERIRVNRDHSPARVIGRAISLDPWNEAGLIGTLQLARTELADETLALAEDGCLDASAGFIAADEQWPTRSIRRVTKALLHHVALTPDPAYTDAPVLAVRGASAPLVSAARPAGFQPTLAAGLSSSTNR